MNITIKNSWEDITWKEYEQIEQILTADIPSSYKTIHLVSILSGLAVDEVERIPVTEFQKLLPALEFLKTEPETHSHQFEYTINGRDYEFRGKIDEITTAQYIDYRAYMDEENKDIVKVMTVFFIPKGHQYNDGYDMEQVKTDIGDLCWLDVRAMCFFFRAWLAAYILILKSSLIRDLKKTKKTLKTRQEVKDLKSKIKELEEHFNNSAYSLLYSEYVSIQIPHSM